jgi:uncharacterized protein YjdB
MRPLVLRWLLVTFSVVAACHDSNEPPAEPVSSVIVDPSDFALEVGGTTQLTARVFSEAGEELDGRAVTWSSAAAGVATVDLAGRVTGVAAGEAIITATVEGVSGTATARVSPRPVAAITIEPSTVTLGEFTSRQLTAILTDADGQPTTAPVAWRTSQPSVASVDAAGLLYGNTPGTATITALAGGKIAIAVVTVVPYPVTSVKVSPASGSVGVGLTLRLTAELRDSANTVLTGRPIAWRSTDEGKATVDAGGLVTGVAPGAVRIAAIANEASDTTELDVVVVPVAALTIVGPSFGLVPGDRLRYDVIAKDAAGNVFAPGSLGPVTWSTSNAGVLAIAAAAQQVTATSVVVGDATLSALLGGKLATVSVAVRLVAFAGTDVGGGGCATSVGASVYCWEGLGDALADIPIGGSTPPREALGGLSLSGLSTGRSHQCALTTGAQAVCWGRGREGQLGIGATPDSVTTPTVVAGGFTFGAVSAGAFHTCGLTTAGKAYCWGADSAGLLGRGASGGSAVPVPVAGGFTFASINAGETHTCALTTGGKAYCWGRNSTGQLGRGDTVSSNTPVPVAGNVVFRSIDAGGLWGGLTFGGFTCGVSLDGQGLCWGENLFGQLGNGTQSAFIATPASVLGGLTFSRISTGMGHACGVTGDGTAFCWGINSSGQLGNGTLGGLSGSGVPNVVTGGLMWSSVSAGNILTCGLSTAGTAYCWGGRAGLFSHFSLSPVKLAGQP